MNRTFLLQRVSSRVCVGLAACAWLVACGPKVEGSDADSGTTQEPTTTQAPTEAGTGTSGATEPTSEPDTAGETAGESEGDTSAGACEPGEVEGEVTCAPIGTAVGFFEFSQGALPEAGPCTVMTIADDGVEVQTITLACEGETFDLEIHTADPHRAVSVTEGMAVDLLYQPYDDVCGGFRGQFGLRDEFGNLLVGGINAPELLVGFDGSPVQVGVVSTNCPSAPGQTCEFDGQLIEHRVALKFTFEEAEEVVFGGSSGQLGLQNSYTFNVSSAEEIVCWSSDECAIECFEQRIDAVWVLSFEG